MREYTSHDHADRHFQRDRHRGIAVQVGLRLRLRIRNPPKGLSEDTVRFISHKKNEPQWMLDWRLRAFRHWERLGNEEPTWRTLPTPRLTSRTSNTTLRPSRRTMAPRASTTWTPKYSRRSTSSASRSRSRSGCPASPWTRCWTAYPSPPPTRRCWKTRGVIFCPNLRGGAEAPRTGAEVSRLRRAVH